MSIKRFGILTSLGPLQKGFHPLLTMAARKANHLRILTSRRWPWSSVRRRNWSIGRPPCTRVGGRMAEAAGECGLLKGRRSLWAVLLQQVNWERGGGMMEMWGIPLHVTVSSACAPAHLGDSAKGTGTGGSRNRIVGVVRESITQRWDRCGVDYSRARSARVYK
jgi:hypothetical protein